MHVGLVTLSSFICSNENSKLSTSISSVGGWSASKLRSKILLETIWNITNGCCNYLGCLNTNRFEVKCRVYSIPVSLLSSIIQPSAPKVRITNFNFGNFKSIKTRALPIDGASVQACHKDELERIAVQLHQTNDQTKREKRDHHACTRMWD